MKTKARLTNYCLYLYFQSIMLLFAVISWQKLFKKSWVNSNCTFGKFQGIVHLDPCFWYVQLLLTTSGTPFCIQTWKATSCPTFFPFVFCISDTTLQHYYHFVYPKKEVFLNSYSPDVYLSEFFKLSLVGLWLGEEDEWPKRYSCLESIVGFFGISVKN